MAPMSRRFTSNSAISSTRGPKYTARTMFRCRRQRNSYSASTAAGVPDGKFAIATAERTGNPRSWTLASGAAHPTDCRAERLSTRAADTGFGE